MFFWPFVPGKISPRERPTTQNDKNNKRSVFFSFLFCFSSLLCFFICVFHVFLAIPPLSPWFAFFIFCCLSFFHSSCFPFSSSFSFELQSSRRRKKETMNEKNERKQHEKQQTRQIRANRRWREIKKHKPTPPPPIHKKAESTNKIKRGVDAEVQMRHSCVIGPETPRNCGNKCFLLERMLSLWTSETLPKNKWRVDHNIRFLRVELYDLRRFRGLHFLFWLSCCFYVWFFVVRLLWFSFVVVVVVVVCLLLLVVVGCCWLSLLFCCCFVAVLLITVVVLLLLLLFCFYSCILFLLSCSIVVLFS